MILAAALLLAAPPAAADPSLTEPEGEIMVVLNRLRTISVNVARDGEGQWQCGLDRSTGRASLDEGLCRAVTQCVRNGAAAPAAVDTCIRSSRARLVRQVEQAMKKEGSQ
jgi:hypothetical protein